MSSKVNEVSLYLFLLDQIKLGKSPANISKEFNISKQKIYYYTTRLKKEGVIKKKSNGIWELVKNNFEHTSKKHPYEIRGHAFIWKVLIPKELGKKWKEILKKNNVDFRVQRNNTIRAYINKRKVWFGKKSLIVYEPHSFYGINAIQSRKYAVISLGETLQAISNKVRIDLTKYPFKPSREHYGLIRNDLAMQLNRQGEKLIIRDDVDGEWLWVDFSDSIGELETGGKGISLDRAGLNKQVQNWWNDNKLNNFKVTPSFLLKILDGHNKQIGQVVQNQEIFDRNISLHQSVLEEIRDAIRDLKDEVRKIK